MKQLFSVLMTVALALTVNGCGKSHEQSGDSGGHHHTAPHGGQLLEIGQHEYNLEFALDRTTGTLNVYVLDAHAENFIRVAMESIELIATADGKTEKLVLKAVANNATGEKVGDTSQFQAQADWLKKAKSFDGVINELNIKGKTETFLPFEFHK